MAGTEISRGAGRIGPLERAVTLALGGWLAARPLRRRASPVALLAAAAGVALGYRAVRGQCPLYRGLGIRTARDLGEDAGTVTARRAFVVTRTQTFLQPSSVVYRAWRQFERWPSFMPGVQSVRALDGRVFHWVVEGPGGRAVEWDAEVVTERPDELVVWRTCPGATLRHEGAAHVTEALGDRGSELRVTLRYQVPGGKPAVVLLKLLGRDPAQMLEEWLRRLKQVLEAGEIARGERRAAA